MLWYKAWLETRTRFLIALAGITEFCSYQVYDLARHRYHAPAEPGYEYFVHVGHQVLTVMWLVGMTLLMMGGLLQEKGAGVSSFTLALPVSRRVLIATRICTGLLQAAALAVIPWVAMVAILMLTGRPGPLGQVGFYFLLLFGGGVVFAGVALFITSLVESPYTGPMISLGIILGCWGAPQSLNFLNPLEFMSGRAYTVQPHVLVGPVPWAHFAANLCVAALFIVASVKILQRRDF